jgi:hypothetical protein
MVDINNSQEYDRDSFSDLLAEMRREAENKRRLPTLAEALAGGNRLAPPPRPQTFGGAFWASSQASLGRPRSAPPCLAR